MYYLTMDWYEKFKCIAGACTLTCCTTDWGIVIDETTYRRYEQIEGPFGEEMIGCIEKDSKQMKRIEGDSRCPMQDEAGLCRIVKELGEDYLCLTCKIYPRFASVYGDVEEFGVHISCPVVAEYLFSGERIQFVREEVEPENGGLEYDDHIYCALAYARETCIEMLQNRHQIPLIGRLYILKLINDDIQNLWKQDNITLDNIKEVLRPYENESNMEELSVQVMALHRNAEVKCNAILNMLSILCVEEAAICFGMDLAKQMENIRDRILRDREGFCAKLQEFSEYCLNYHRVYENYFVYQLFLRFIDIPKGRSYFETAVLELLSIQLIAMEAWENQELTREKYKDIFARTSRFFEHTEKKREAIDVLLKQFDLQSNAYILFWLLI